MFVHNKNILIILILTDYLYSNEKNHALFTLREENRVSLFIFVVITKNCYNDINKTSNVKIVIIMYSFINNLICEVNETDRLCAFLSRTILSL